MNTEFTATNESFSQKLYTAPVTIALHQAFCNKTDYDLPKLNSLKPKHLFMTMKRIRMPWIYE